MHEFRPYQVGDKVKVIHLKSLEHFIGEVGEIIRVTPYEEGCFIDVALYGGKVKIRVYEPPSKLELIQ